MRIGQGEWVRGNAGNTVKSGQNERDGRQQGPPSKGSVFSLVTPGLPLGHKCSKDPRILCIMDGQPGGIRCPEIKWGGICKNLWGLSAILARSVFPSSRIQLADAIELNEGHL